MKMRILVGVGAVFLALLLAAEPAEAGRGGGGGGGRGAGGGGRGFAGGGGRGYYGGGRGYYGGGYGRGYYGGGWGWGGVGIGIDLGYPLYSGYSLPYYGDDGIYYYPQPSPSPAPGYYYGAAPATPPADNKAHIRVVVPEGAKVWFGTTATTQTGAVRYFESPPLADGKDFTYEVKARWRDQDGKEVTRTRQVDVRANAALTVDFTQPG
jgi:uncharacterized protein (TIGR03000 family)